MTFINTTIGAIGNEIRGRSTREDKIGNPMGYDERKQDWINICFVDKWREIKEDLCQRNRFSARRLGVESLVRFGSTLALISVLLQLYGASPQNCRSIATLFQVRHRIFH